MGRDRVESRSSSTARLEQEDHQDAGGEQRSLRQHPRGVQDHRGPVSNSDPLISGGTGNIRHEGVAQQGTLLAHLRRPLEFWS